jgi:hypothetical protein
VPDEAMYNAKGLGIGKDEEYQGAIETILYFEEEPVETGSLLLLFLLFLLFLFVLWHFLQVLPILI